MDERFNWPDISRRTLGRHWSKRSDKEKKEFIDLYGKLLERTYLSKVGDYSGEKVIYLREVIDGNYSLVCINIIDKTGAEIPVKYKLKKKGDDRLVYDISIEGVSLVNNYRSQFNSIIMRSSFEKLIEQLKIKVAEE